MLNKFLSCRATAPTTIPASKLKHGDVLLYKYVSHASIIDKGIRLITGSFFVHTSVIQDIGYTKIVLEQLTAQRDFSVLEFYRPDAYVEIHVVRPTFEPPETDKSLINHASYGWVDIWDSLLNHLMGRITFGHWEKKPMLSKNAKVVDCSTLNALALKAVTNCSSWCKYPSVVEPDDYFNHVESFDYLGRVDWES